jgi:hypothetical protein
MTYSRMRLGMYWVGVAMCAIALSAHGTTESNIALNEATFATSFATSAAPVTPSAADMPTATEAFPALPLADAVPANVEPPLETDQVGLASWYGNQHQGRLTASGEPFDEAKLTAAHRLLPLETKVRVTNLENGRSVEVTVNDRGPYVEGRVLDLSTRAAKELDMQKEGLALVRIEILPQQFASTAFD